MEPVDVDTFEALVAEALATIPDQLRSEMENVAIIIDDESPPGPLYGLYEGVPLTKRGNYAGANPDRITLFLATICRSATTPEDLAPQSAESRCSMKSVTTSASAKHACTSSAGRSPPSSRTGRPGRGLVGFGCHGA